MKKWLQKILVIHAFLIAWAHNVLPHHHHEDTYAVLYHHDHDDHDHNPFSFKYLDHNFISSKADVAAFENGPVTLPILLENQHTVLSFALQPAFAFVFKNEFPPPGGFNHITTLRGPPVS